MVKSNNNKNKQTNKQMLVPFPSDFVLSRFASLPLVLSECADKQLQNQAQSHQPESSAGHDE